MAAAVTNPFKLTWGSFECGGTTERLIVGVHRISRTFESFEVSCDILIRGTSDATFATNCAEMESEFAKRRLLLKWEVGSSTVQTFNPADGTNTGLNSYARIDKAGAPGADTDRSRLYTVTLGCGLPATDASGRRDSSLVVDYDPAKRRTVTITGEWTAVTTNNATAQYAAQIDAFCSSALTALLPSGTFERVGERTDRDDQDKTLRFMRVFREIIVAQPSGSLDNANIVDPSLSFHRNISQPGDSGGGGVKRLEAISSRFECWLDKTASTDLQTLYTGTIRPYIVSQLESTYSPSQYGITSENVARHPYTNQVTVDVEFMCAIDATDVIESVTTSRIVEAGGHAFTGAWTGGIFDKYVDQGHATRRRLGIRAVRVLGTVKPSQRIGGGGGSLFGVTFSGGASVNPDQGGGGWSSATGNGPMTRAQGSHGWGPIPGVSGESDPVFGGDSPAGGGLGAGVGAQQSGWIMVENDSAATPKWIGQPGGDQIAVTDIVETTVEEWVTPPSGGGGGVGGVSFGPGGEVAPAGGIFVK